MDFAGRLKDDEMNMRAGREGDDWSVEPMGSED